MILGLELEDPYLVEVHVMKQYNNTVRCAQAVVGTVGGSSFGLQEVSHRRCLVGRVSKGEQG